MSVDDWLDFLRLCLLSAALSQPVYWLCVWRIRAGRPHLPPAPKLTLPDHEPYFVRQRYPRPHRVRTQYQTLGSTAAAGDVSRSTYPQVYSITDPDVWTLLEKAYAGNATRAHVTTTTGMTHRDWAAARQWLLDKQLLDRKGRPLVSKSRVKRAELV